MTLTALGQKTFLFYADEAHMQTNICLVIEFVFKMESTLFVSAKLTFLENLICFNLPLLVGLVSQKRLLS